MDGEIDSGVSEEPISSGAEDAAIDSGGGGEEPEGTPPKAATTAEEQAAKIKARVFGGEEREFTQDELLQYLSPDYEHEFTVAGEKKRAKFEDLVRGYQLSQGAYAKMREAAELRKRFEQERERGKSETDWYLSEVLGVDPIEWANKLLYERVQQDEEIAQLMQQNPAKAMHRMREIERERVQRQLEAERRKEQSKREAEEQSKREAERKRLRAEFEQKIPGVLKHEGLPVNPTTKSIFARIGQQYAQVGNPLPLEHVARLTRDEYYGEVSGFFDSMDDERLIKFLGDKRRKRLRELEIKAMRPQEKQQREQQRQQRERDSEKSTSQMTEAEFLRRHGVVV